MEKFIENMFETYNISGLNITDTCTSALFSVGRTTGTVLDIGHEISYCKSIDEGLYI